MSKEPVYVCPVCRREFGPKHKFCVTHGVLLVAKTRREEATPPHEAGGGESRPGVPRLLGSPPAATPPTGRDGSVVKPADAGQQKAVPLTPSSYLYPGTARAEAMQNTPPWPLAARRSSPTEVEYLPPPPAAVPSVRPAQEMPATGAAPTNREATAAAGIARMLGLDPRIALIAVVLDTMLFAGEIATFGVLVVFSVLAGMVFGFIVYKGQRNWYGDDHDSALIKALVMGLLTAVPSPLPAFLYLPAGLMGLVNLMRRK